jgi:hypothetical protein
LSFSYLKFKKCNRTFDLLLWFYKNPSIGKPTNKFEILAQKRKHFLFGGNALLKFFLFFLLPILNTVVIFPFLFCCPAVSAPCAWLITTHTTADADSKHTQK